MSKRFILAMFALCVLAQVEFAAGEFVPGHIYLVAREAEVCELGGEEWIVDVDPETGEFEVFAHSESDPGICAITGVRFTPDGRRLLALNYGFILVQDVGGVQSFQPDGQSETILDERDGMSGPHGHNGLAFDGIGDLYVVNSDNSSILRVPADGSPSSVFATGLDGIFGSGALEIALNGDLFYAGKGGR